MKILFFLPLITYIFANTSSKTASQLAKQDNLDHVALALEKIKNKKPKFKKNITFLQVKSYLKNAQWEQVEASLEQLLKQPKNISLELFELILKYISKENYTLLLNNLELITISKGYPIQYLKLLYQAYKKISPLRGVNFFTNIKTNNPNTIQLIIDVLIENKQYKKTSKLIHLLPKKVGNVVLFLWLSYKNNNFDSIMQYLNKIPFISHTIMKVFLDIINQLNKEKKFNQAQILIKNLKEKITLTDPIRILLNSYNPKIRNNIPALEKIIENNPTNPFIDYLICKVADLYLLKKEFEKVYLFLNKHSNAIKNKKLQTIYEKIKIFTQFYSNKKINKKLLSSILKNNQSLDNTLLLKILYHQNPQEKKMILNKLSQQSKIPSDESLIFQLYLEPSLEKQWEAIQRHLEYNPTPQKIIEIYKTILSIYKHENPTILSQEFNKLKTFFHYTHWEKKDETLLYCLTKLSLIKPLQLEIEEFLNKKIKNLPNGKIKNSYYLCLANLKAIKKESFKPQIKLINNSLGFLREEELIRYYDLKNIRKKLSFWQKQLTKNYSEESTLTIHYLISKIHNENLNPNKALQSLKIIQNSFLNKKITLQQYQNSNSRFIYFFWADLLSKKHLWQEAHKKIELAYKNSYSNYYKNIILGRKAEFLYTQSFFLKQKKTLLEKAKKILLTIPNPSIEHIYRIAKVCERLTNIVSKEKDFFYKETIKYYNKIQQIPINSLIDYYFSTKSLFEIAKFYNQHKAYYSKEQTYKKLLQKKIITKKEFNILNKRVFYQ